MSLLSGRELAMKITTLNIILFLIIFNSCTVKIYLPEGTSASAKQVEEQLDFIKNQYPRAFQLTQRIVLTVAGKQYDFIGSLKMNSDSSFHMIAVGEMGGVFLELKHENGTSTIVRNPSRLPENPLLDGVVQDILFLYLSQSGLKFDTSNKRENKIFIQMKNADTGSVLYTFDSGVLKKTEQIKNGKLLREVHYSGYKKNENEASNFPGRITINNKKWRYTLKLDLLKFKAIDNL
jgi:hypothetical protein